MHMRSMWMSFQTDGLRMQEAVSVDGDRASLGGCGWLCGASTDVIPAGAPNQGCATVPSVGRAP